MFKVMYSVFVGIGSNALPATNNSVLKIDRNNIKNGNDFFSLPNNLIQKNEIRKKPAENHKTLH